MKLTTLKTAALTALLAASTSFAAGTVTQSNNGMQPNQDVQQVPSQHRSNTPTQMDHNQDGSVTHSEHRQYNQIRNANDIERETNITTQEELGQRDEDKPFRDTQRVN
ncbi:MAG TPA: hypothetical protein DDW29_17005 [Gammaproteobacteria bacterium]|nr:hypothetical protein [Gammaproteobacteria bacterium]|tara:strand:+ start:67360 stop:67683 length:324 start_codon:yes stop_codon:yes gene_type:complete